jgi:hypothetical protein
MLHAGMNGVFIADHFATRLGLEAQKNPIY